MPLLRDVREKEKGLAEKSAKPFIDLARVDAAYRLP